MKHRMICLILLIVMALLAGCAAPVSEAVSTVPATTVAETTVPVTEVSDTVPTAVSTEPPEERFLLTFVGDCTFGANPTNTDADFGFIKTVGED